MAWSIVGVGTSVEVTATSHTLTVPAGVAAGDLLVACISSRIASTTSITLPTGGEWTLVGEQKANNILSTGSAVASGMMAYCVRGASDPNLTFTHPTAPAPALGRIVAYRGGATPTASAKDTQTSSTTAISITAVNLTGMTTTVADALLVAMLAGGQEAAWSVFKSANTPSTASGATDTTTAPSTTTWIERADVQTTTSNDTSLGIFDAVKTAAGATGNFTATASVAASHALVAGAFKIFTPVSVSASVTGVEATAAIGDVTVTAIGPVTDRQYMLGGPLGVIFVSETSNRSYALAGGYVAETIPVAAPSGAVTVSVTGVSATGSVGTVTVTTVASVSVPVTGVQGTGAVDQVTAIGRTPVSVPVTGVQATGAVDSVTVVGKANVSTTGVAATGSVGSVTVIAATGVSVPVTGVQGTGSVGSVTVTGKSTAVVTGVSATGSVGTVTVTAGTGATVLVTGVAAAGAVDSVTVVGKANVALTGVQATGTPGGVSVTAGGSVSIVLAGVQATGSVGSVTVAVVQGAVVPVTGVAAIASVGSVTVTAAELAGLVSVWNGSAWVDKPAKVWSGSAWQQKPVKHWTGSAWV